MRKYNIDHCRLSYILFAFLDLLNGVFIYPCLCILQTELLFLINWELSSISKLAPKVHLFSVQNCYLILKFEKLFFLIFFVLDNKLVCILKTKCSFWLTKLLNQTSNCIDWHLLWDSVLFSEMHFSLEILFAVF